MTALSIIVATSGRPTLARTLASIAPQLEHGDEILVERLDCNWGHEARDDAIPRARGTHLMFLDDDDVYVVDALRHVREAVAAEPDRVHIFRMLYAADRRVLWRDPRVYVGNVGTPMIVVPNQPNRLGAWGSIYEGDAAFLTSTLALRGDAPAFHEEVIAVIRPELTP